MTVSVSVLRGASTIAPAFAALAVALAGCRKVEAGRAAAPAVRDSAGVTIVENRAPAWGSTPGLRLDPRPLLDLGGVAGDSALDFSGVGGTVRLASGRIAVADGATGQIRIFDERGLLLRRLGGRGTGPGEFTALASLYRLPGDSIAAWDRGRAALTIFGPEGRVARSVSLAPDSGGAAALRPVGVLGGGEVLAAGSLPVVRDGAAVGVRRDSVPYLAIAPDGRRRVVGHFLGDELFVELRGQTVRAALLPFGRTTAAVVRGPGFVLATGDADLRTYDSAGALRRSVRWPAERRAVTSGDSVRFIADLLVGVRDPMARQPQEHFWRTVPFPKTLPPHGAIRVGAGGELWVEEPNADRKLPTRYHVFATDGRWLGTLTLPERFTLFEVGTDYLLGAWKDPDDVEHVRMYGLER